MTAYAVHPGIVRTKIDRNLSVYSSYIAKVFVKPFFWFFHKTPEQGSTILSIDVREGASADVPAVGLEMVSGLKLPQKNENK